MLPMHTGLRCPMCGAMNPVSNAYCDRCNARIVPMASDGEDSDRSPTPVRGLSLPTIPLEEPPARAEPEPEAPEEASIEEDTDWLAQLRDMTAEEEDKDVGLPAESVAETEAADDWLAQLRDSADAVDAFEPATAAEPIEPVEIPDWLQGLGPMGPGVAPSEPATRADVAPPADSAPPVAGFPLGTETTEAAPEPAGASDWLQDLAPTEAKTPEEAVFEEAIPSESTGTFDWLQELAPAQPETPEAPTVGEMAPPESGAPFDAGIGETTPGTPEPESAETPDWLRGMAPVEAETAGPPAFEETAPPETPAPFDTGIEEAASAFPTPVSADVPDWLQELAPAQAETPGAPAFEDAIPPESAPPFDVGSDESTPGMETLEPTTVPDWLRDLAPTEEPPAAPAFEETIPTEAAVPPSGEVDETIPGMPTPGPAAVPDWMQDLAPAEEGTPRVPSEETPPFEAAAPFEGGIDETQPAAPASGPAGVPDWLKDLGPPGAVEETAPGPPTPALADVPEWLMDSAPSGAPEAAASPGGGIDEAVPGIGMPGPAGIPDWLQEMAPAEPAPAQEEESAAEWPEPPEAAPSAGPAPIAAEVPDWLRSAAPASPPPFVAAPVPGTEESPEWLEGLREEEAQPTPPPAAPEGVPPFVAEPEGEPAEATGLARARIPSWLEAMRPTAEEPVEVAVDEGPVETEGILEGLRGVLAPLPIAEEAPPQDRALEAAVDEATLARAQLLQSLLTRSTQAPRAQVQEQQTGIAERAPRWLITIVLFVIVTGTLLPRQFDLGYTVPTLTQPQESVSVSVHDTIESVNAGDPVLVAFEYGLSEADELNVVAESILVHLSEREADISTVSSQPEGIGVAAKLRGDLEAAEQITLTYASVQYLPGDAAGIAGLLSAMEPKPKLIVVLAAKPAPLRWWIEQTGALGQAPPVVAGISAMLEQIASPYLNGHAGPLQGAVVGVRGAAGYEARRGRSGPAAERLDTLALSQITVAALILAGAALYFLSGPRRRIA